MVVLCAGALYAGAAQATDVRVETVKMDGTIAPLVGAEVGLETWKTAPGMSGPTRTLDEVRHVRSGGDGVARFEGSVGKGGEVIASLVHEGVTYTSGPLQGDDVTLRVYGVTGDVGALGGRMTVGLDVRDGFLLVETTLSLSNRSRQTIDTRRTEGGFRVPVALPAVLGGTWEAGVIPSDTGPRHVHTRATPEQGRFQFRDGAVFFEGPVVPGRNTTLQARYALPLIDTRQDVALTSPVPLEQLLVTTTWTDRVAPRVVPDREFLVVGRDPGESVQRFMRVERPPAAGETFVLHVDRLPQPDDVQNQLAVGGGVALFVIFGLSLVALRRRDV